MQDKKLFGTVTVGSKGQVVIPAEAREAFQINSGDHLYVLGSAHSKTLSFIPEEQMRSFISAFTENVDQFKDMLDDTTSDTKENK